jgi:helix-turn-helix, Psq domain
MLHARPRAADDVFADHSQSKLVAYMEERNEIGDAFAAALKLMLKKRRLTICAAARDLEVSRQTFHSYLKGKLPRRLERAGTA